MSIAALPRTVPAYVPLRLAHQSLAVRTLAVLAATGFLAACSWIAVPMLPVPITMQTFGVTVVGAVFGWRLGAMAVLAWLVEAAIGMPVLTNGAAGLAYMSGPTAGYLVAFPVIAALVGWAAERGVTARGLIYSFSLMLLANALILAIGASWLAALLGPTKAIALGVTPFLIGGVLKSGLAATLVEAARRHLAR